MMTKCIAEDDMPERTDWEDKARMKNSMRLMAEEVMPRVNQVINSRAASAG